MKKLEITISQEASIRTMLWMLSFIAIGITAWFSTGYFHADEHYQIIEFAGYPLGWNQEHELAWEFQRHIRPTLQPWIASGIIKSLHAIGVKDPYHVAFVLRFIMGIAMLFALRFFYRKAQNSIIETETNRSYYRLSFFAVLFLTWFIPFLSVRYSSETAAAAALLVAFGYLLEKNEWKNNLFVIGIWFGISFSFRFQIGFAGAGLGLWYIFFQRNHLIKFGQFIAGFGLIGILAFLLDSLFYQSWTFTPWNYFAVNILEGESSTFGESGLNYYLVQSFWLPTSLLGTIYLLSYAYNLIVHFKSPIVWCVTFFIVGHLLIGHKEERFLFPIAFVLPYFVFTLLMDLHTRFNSKKIIQSITGLFVLYNLVLFAFAFPSISMEDCGLGRTRITKYIHETYKQPVTLIRPWYSNPYNPWEGLPQRFYLDKNVTDVRVDHVKQFQDTLKTIEGTILVSVSESNLLNEGYQKALFQNKFKLVKRSVSQRKYTLDRYTKAIDKKSVLYLYELKK